MRAMLGILWLFIGLGALIFHYGPGLTYSKLDTSGQHAQLAYQAAEAGRWTEAVDQYAEALGSLPEGHEADAFGRPANRGAAALCLADRRCTARQSDGDRRDGDPTRRGRAA